MERVFMKEDYSKNLNFSGRNKSQFNSILHFSHLSINLYNLYRYYPSSQQQTQKKITKSYPSFILLFILHQFFLLNEVICTSYCVQGHSLNCIAFDQMSFLFAACK
ncbi:hypothetical protein CHS0354_017548 [Potamilus streckersoni]|uniref:Uncharacterized protein n=1 Tax=Potamilus streckersoni TaxID=2493646 RepID=A0AAE0TFZ9_9BIVA|nr:hypothetical protein CHS0354_017548 [Potamilus streckersoni]